MEKRTLWIHAGGSKTGSSALQNFFEYNTSYLNSNGFSYANKVNINFEQQVTGGNGRLLYETLKAPHTTEQELTSVILSYFECLLPNALCSSEFLQHLDVLSWKRLLDILKQNEIEVNIIYFIRNALPFFLSGYDQLVKGHGEWRDIVDWSVNINWDHMEAVRVLEQVFTKDNIRLYSYEQEKHRLLEVFINSIGIKYEQNVINQIKNIQTVNRSLTIAERNILQKINKEFGDRYSAEISTMLISKFPNLPTQFEQSQDLVQQLTSRYQNDVKWINDTFFDNENIVSIGVFPKNSDKNSDSIPEDMYRTIFDWFLSKFAKIKNDASESIYSRIMSVISDMDGKNIDMLPADFNPIGYLLLNKDILFADINPIEHYRAFGKNENRNYLLPNNCSAEEQQKSLNLLKKSYQENMRLENKIRELNEKIVALENEKRTLVQENLCNILNLER